MILHIEPATPLNDKTGEPMSEREFANAAPYPKFGVTVTKFHKLPRTPENIKAHAEALFAQLRSLQRSEWKRSLKSEPENGAAPCASGTWHSDGKSILKAIRAQQRADLDGALAAEHRARNESAVRYAYEAAMRGEHAPLVRNCPQRR